jgi:hypothetical protein
VSVSNVSIGRFICMIRIYCKQVGFGAWDAGARVGIITFDGRPLGRHLCHLSYICLLLNSI